MVGFSHMSCVFDHPPDGTDHDISGMFNWAIGNKVGELPQQHDIFHKYEASNT